MSKNNSPKPWVVMATEHVTMNQITIQECDTEAEARQVFNKADKSGKYYQVIIANLLPQSIRLNTIRSTTGNN